MRKADCLCDVSVGVQFSDPVFTFGQRTNEPLAVEQLRRVEMPLILGYLIEFGQHIAHSAEFNCGFRLPSVRKILSSFSGFSSARRCSK